MSTAAPINKRSFDDLLNPVSFSPQAESYKRQRTCSLSPMITPSNSPRAVRVELPPFSTLKSLGPHYYTPQYSQEYPDTAYSSSVWKRDLLNMSEYQQVLSENKLDILSSVALYMADHHIPSINYYNDQFSGLSKYSPPQTCTKLVPETPVSHQSPRFTPVVSSKIVKEVKINTHKKTNSFKARKIKALLESRNVLASDSKRVEFIPPSLPSSPPASPVYYRETVQAVEPAQPVQQTVVTTPVTSPQIKHTFIVASPKTMTPPGTQEQSRTPSSGRKNSSGHGRKCLSCLSTDSPCWRPSWNPTQQLCNSCGLRYKKTKTRCLKCRKIPAKGEWSVMQSNGVVQRVDEDGTVLEGLACLGCSWVCEDAGHPKSGEESA